MDDWVEPIRMLAALGFTGLLVMLRLEADRFGAAEYAEIDRYGRGAPLRRRLAWYVLGLILVVATWLDHPGSPDQLYLALGDRGRGAGLGLIYGAIGIAQAVAFAWLRYRHLRLPGGHLLPGRAAQLGRHRVHRRSRVPRRRPRLPHPHRVRSAARDRHPGHRLRARHPARGARSGPLHARPVARHRARLRLRDPPDRRHRGGLPGPRDHPLRDVRRDRPRRSARAGRAARTRRSRRSGGSPRAGRPSGRARVGRPGR